MSKSNSEQSINLEEEPEEMSVSTEEESQPPPPSTSACDAPSIQVGSTSKGSVPSSCDVLFIQAGSTSEATLPSTYDYPSIQEGSTSEVTVPSTCDVPPATTIQEEPTSETTPICDAPPPAPPPEAIASDKEEDPSLPSTSAAVEAHKKKRDLTNRCHVCSKKVGLTGGTTCRCGGLFCPHHRYTDTHNCPFDYKQLGAEEIRKNNPVVQGEKIHKI